jgi:hypothetical protein
MWPPNCAVGGDALPLRPEAQAVGLKPARSRWRRSCRDFRTDWDQNRCASNLRNAHRLLNVQISIPIPVGEPLVEHDRIILLDLSQGETQRFYRVLLGQGIFGF